jgi:hypothetical protein
MAPANKSFLPFNLPSRMQLSQLVYVSAYFNEYGLDLTDFVQKSFLANKELSVKGMSLFSNGNIMQLLEGNDLEVGRTYQQIKESANTLGVSFEMLHKTLDAPSLTETSIGLDRYSFNLMHQPPTGISIFLIGPGEVDKRIRESPAKALMMQFAADHL